MSISWNVGRIISKRNLISPDKTALIFEDRLFSYKELNNGVNRCVSLLCSKGIGFGDRICVLLNNCVEFFEIFFAAAKIGAVFVPLNCRLIKPELEFQINDCGAKILFFQNIFLEEILSVHDFVKISSDNFIQVGNNIKKESFLKKIKYSDSFLGMSIDEPEINTNICLDDPLVIIYTSGVTGNPKGAVMSHGSVYYRSYQIGEYIQTREGDRILSQIPMYHSGGLFAVAIPSIFNAVTIILRSEFKPEKFVDDIDIYKPTVILALPSLWKKILNTGRIDEIDISSVRVVLSAGEKVFPSLIHELGEKGLLLQYGFGLTENSAMMIVPKEDVYRKIGSVGKTGCFTNAWIEDPLGKKLNPGEIGEIVATGPTLMSCYWNMPEITDRTIVDGVLHTGDIGYMDEERFFYVVERTGDMYRSGGEWVYPIEVEQHLMKHPKISLVSIIGVYDQKWGEAGLALIVPVPGITLIKEEIMAFLSGRISKFKYPKHVKIVKELPLTATNKVIKSKLKEKYSKEFAE